MKYMQLHLKDILISHNIKTTWWFECCAGVSMVTLTSLWLHSPICSKLQCKQLLNIISIKLALNI